MGLCPGCRPFTQACCTVLQKTTVVMVHPGTGRYLHPAFPIPLWFSELQAGKPRRFDVAVTSSSWSRALGRWVLLLLLMAGDVERNPGPYRGPMDTSVGFVPATASRMSKCFEAFTEWCGNFLEVPWQSLAADYEALGMALRGYGLYLFEHGHPRYLLVYAITSCQEYFPGCKVAMAPAWQIDKKWQVHEPGSCRAVLPAIVIKAATALALLWSWTSWAGLLLLGVWSSPSPERDVEPSAAEIWCFRVTCTLIAPACMSESVIPKQLDSLAVSTDG